MPTLQSITTIPWELRHAILKLLNSKTESEFTMTQLETGFLVSEPTLLPSGVTRIYLRGVRKYGFTGTSHFDYYRVSLATFFKSVKVTVDLNQHNTVVSILEQIKLLYGVNLDPNDFESTVETGPNTIKLITKTNSYVWTGTLKVHTGIKISQALNPTTPISNTASNAMPYSWVYSFAGTSDFTNLTDLELIASQLRNITADHWGIFHTLAEFNLCHATIRYNGPTTPELNRPESNVLVIALNPHYCSNLSGLLYLFY